MIHLRSSSTYRAVAIAPVSSLLRAQAETSVGRRLPADRRPVHLGDARRSFDAAAKEAGYTIDWRQFSSGVTFSTASLPETCRSASSVSTGTTARRPAASGSNFSGSGQYRQVGKRSSPEKDPASKSRKT